MFLDNPGEQTTQQLVDDLGSFIFAGNDTSAFTLASIFHRINQHPEVKEKLMAEVKQYLPEGWTIYNFGKVFDKDTINEMNYLQAVVKESLRYDAVGPTSLTYKAKEDITIRGVQIPKGQLIY